MYCYDANGNATSRQGGALTWTSYNLPSAIVFGSNSTTFNYNASHQRWKQDANYAGVHEVTYYIGGLMEKVTKGTGPTEYRHLIPAGSGSSILTRRSDLTNSTYYMTSDHLGSGDLVLSSTATVLAKESFTPFGARRGSNWQGVPTTADYTVFSNTSRRGFTGHEMLDSVGLVHMNGRVYDPTIGRFLSADPIIQTIALSQAINPFSYVMNMPLTLTDPSGLSWLSKLFSGIGSFLKKFWKPILAIIVVIVAMPYIAAYLANSVAMSAAQSAFALTGDLSIALDAGVTAAAVAAPWIATVSGAIAGAMAGAISGGANGAFAGAITGGLLAGIGANYGNRWTVGRVVEEGTAGGLGSVAQGGSFRDGFELVGAFSALRWAAHSMRASMVAESCTPSGNVNCAGTSDGAFGDHVKLGGGRANYWGKWIPERVSPLGGNQGGPGSFFGRSYDPGSFLDYAVESFAGSHDWLSSFRYGLNGNLIPYTGFGSAVYTLYSAAAVAIAAPFAFTTAVPTLAFAPATQGSD